MITNGTKCLYQNAARSSKILYAERVCKIVMLETLCTDDTRRGWEMIDSSWS